MSFMIAKAHCSILSVFRKTCCTLLIDYPNLATKVHNKSENALKKRTAGGKLMMQATCFQKSKTSNRARMRERRMLPMGISQIRFLQQTLAKGKTSNKWARKTQQARKPENRTISRFVSALI